MEVEYERDVPDEVQQNRRERGREALGCLDRMTGGPRAPGVLAMRPWHRGIYLSYTFLATDPFDWKPAEWQVEILEGMVREYVVFFDDREVVVV